MSKFLLLVTLVSVFSFSCQNNGKGGKEYEVPLFEDNEIAQINFFKTDKLLGSIYSIHVFNDYLFVGSLADNYYIHIFNKNTGDFIKSVAPKGRGPGEFIDHVLSIDFIKDTIYLSENRSERPMQVYKLNELLNGSNNFKTINITGCSRSYLAILPLKEGFLSTPTTKGNRFAIHDKNGNLTSRYHVFPDLGLDTLQLWDIIQMRSHIALNPDRNKFAVTTMLGAILEVYSVNNNKISLEKELKFYPPKILVNKSHSRSNIHPDCIIGFWNIVATSNFIYTIFSGKKNKDFQTVLADFVYVFDWNGNPLKSYTVPCKIRRLSIDEKTKRAYISTVDKDGISVFGYFNL